MKALKILMILVAVVVVIVMAGLFFVTRFVNTPEFKDEVLKAARESAGTDVKVGEMKVSIFSGIDLTDVTVANPAGFTGNLLTAKAFALHYRLLPLLQKRVEVETLTLDTPVITLAKNDKGDWNHEKLGGSKEKEAPKQTGVKSSPEKRTTSTGSSLDIAVSNIEMKHASVVMQKDSGKELLRINDANFSSAVNYSGGKITGKGKTSIAEAIAANSLFLRNVAAPVTLDGDTVKLAPLSGKVADGSVAGDAALIGSKYSVNLQVKDADVVKLIQEAGVAKKVFTSGKLQLTTALTGTGGLETIDGSGKAEITGGQLADIPLLSSVGSLLQIPALKSLKFDECRFEYTISSNVMQTPVISLKSPEVQITGSGSVTLADNTLKHTFTLALAGNTLDHAPKEVQKLFTKRADGFYTIDFKVWGPYDSPKTDLQNRLLEGVGEQLLEKGLKKYLK